MDAFKLKALGESMHWSFSVVKVTIGCCDVTYMFGKFSAALA
jgi:hypothetical protein